MERKLVSMRLSSKAIKIVEAQRKKENRNFSNMVETMILREAELIKKKQTYDKRKTI